MINGDLQRNQFMSSFLSRGIQTTMSTKSVSFFSRKSRPEWVSSGIVEATMNSACHSIFLNQVPWLQAMTVQVQKHPSDVLAASHHIVLHDHRPQFWLVMPAQLDNMSSTTGNIMNHIPQAPTLFVQFVWRHVLNSGNITAARCWRVKWDWDVLASKQPSKQFG